MQYQGKDIEQVASFLFRTATALATFLNETTSEELETKSSDVQYLSQFIAKKLLVAFEHDVLLNDTKSLPDIAINDHVQDSLTEMDDDHDDDGDDDNSMDPAKDGQQYQIYKYRRTDYLRLLLRFMAPVSMQIASLICHDVSLGLQDRTHPSDYGPARAAFLLFSHWLPVASHLTPMVTDLFLQMKEPWKNLDFSQHSSVFLFVEASYKLCSFFGERQQSFTIQRLWDWTFLFDILQISDTEMSGDETVNTYTRFVPRALHWYAARALTVLLDWKPQVTLSVLERLEVADPHVAWEPHPWTLEREERNAQIARFRGVAKLWTDEEFVVPSAEIVHECLSTSPYLAHVGNGISFYKRGTLNGSSELRDSNVRSKANDLSGKTEKALIPTATTCTNLALLGAALCQEPYPPPIMLCGPQGAGKSSVLREMLRLCRPGDALLEFHIDEETDAKTLIGTYSTTDIPGEFAWRPGALTHASREGRWVLFEDIDTVPIEIQATIVKLLEDRVLPLGNGKYEKCHPDFRIFATCTTIKSDYEKRSSQRFGGRRGGGKRILNPTLWRKVHVQPLPFSELKEVATALFQQIPLSVIDVALSTMQSLDTSGRSANSDSSSSNSNAMVPSLDPRSLASYTGGRTPSVRDLFKLLSRIALGVYFEKDVTYATEAQRMICLTETVEVLVGSCPDWERKQDFVARIAAPAWSISGQLALAYVDSRCPSTRIAADFVEIGRVQIHFGRHSEFARKQSATFAETNHALRLMESIGVCVRQNEPILLVGETGCGKTTLVQQLAGLCERELMVQNLSLQTDSTDLLGGFKPLELKNVARKVYLDFVDLFVSTFSRKQNVKFLEFASSMLEKESWKKLSQCFQRAAQLGTSKMKEKLEIEQDGASKKNQALAMNWDRFKESATKFERQILSCDAGLAFIFSEGALVDAIKNGKWVLLDEINLASSDTLQRLCGLLDDPTGSVTLTERGDASEIPRHPNFRLFAAMNPATDAGKKDLPASIRSRFSELYVQELLDPVELRVVAARYLDGVLPVDGKPPEHKDIIITVVEVYLKCREMADTVLSDGAGHKPRYTLRTLSRALHAAKTLILCQRLPLARALFEGFQLAFEGALDSGSVKAVKKVLKALLPSEAKSSDLEHPGRRPNSKDASEYVLIKPFWIKTGPESLTDWSEASADGKARFILTPSIASSLRKLSRALAAGPWPLLLEGPTSAGKTTLVEYIAARCGHHVVRINNHEHTDVQEYTGSFVADQNGSLSFRDGLLVRALRRGHWVILDELNLAPSEVLEALNRLLDDNRELYLAETSETVKPHPNFRLFATQNPSGAYGGRKPLSRAFRNRFVEVHMGDIPSEEMITILEKRCGCPRSIATRLVDVMVALRYHRSKKNLFLGKDSFITPRDLLRWAERNSSSRSDFAEQGYMLLAERLRSDEEKEMVKSVLEEHLKVRLNPHEMYYGASSTARQILEQAWKDPELSKDPLVNSMAPTRSLLRLIRLVMTCMEQKEPVLLVGETGCGKTTVVQFLSLLQQKKLFSVNCHATTETSDLLGGLRPVRGRDVLQQNIFTKLRVLVHRCFLGNLLKDLKIPETLLPKYRNDDGMEENEAEATFVDGKSMPNVDEMVAISRAIAASLKGQEDDTASNDSRMNKRRKLSSSCSSSDEDNELEKGIESLNDLMKEIDVLANRYNSLFEWSDGPLVTAMKSGEMLLLDEMSLAEDAVLERLNSVLEPSRTLVLAEKGDDGSLEENRVVVAHEGFRIFATMNPGGDFGKRELSPALRSRFTEIWVPPVIERTDYELVLSRTFDPSNPVSQRLVEKMLDYVDWFNNSICGDTSSPCANYVLSLRDILSWAHFIDEACKCNHDLDVWEAYIHGAALMHLDGLGLGAGLAVEDAKAVREKAEAFLAMQLSTRSAAGSILNKEINFAIYDGKRFGASPFYIGLGPLDVSKIQFNMAAPTTATNAFRVLRAMQIKKPVLLEGSPGVGKTSLITALAAASGNELVRINLSEQTDIADLMGSDLPVQDSSGRGAAFEWSDGVLLRAIKNGSWVLLDELNLASQSVLEGLNSCLDHRASVYIPELGKTYHCPATFRIFGAQNPLNQGGGRKGLPKSFLNRFTKVYVEALTDSDLRSIVTARYPSFDKPQIDAMIDFNNAVHNEVVENRIFGSDGAPWEFNLRDVFRWCQILESKTSSIQSCARDIYLQRFRSANDRTKVDLLFQKFFAFSMDNGTMPPFRITDSTVQIGDASLARMEPFHGVLKNPERGQAHFLLSHLLPLEAVARCIALRWPCLVIGPPSSGKTSVIAALAETCNTTLVEQNLSPSSDVTELLGCFEQVEQNEFELKIASNVCKIAQSFFCVGALKTEASKELWNTVKRMQKYVDEGIGFDDNSAIRTTALALCHLLQEATKRFDQAAVGPLLHTLQSLIIEINETMNHDNRSNASHFVWRDGILVEAMLQGHWLVLNNVNLCPSSVLDRLNSVMENDGELLLSECGTLDARGELSHRVIRPHPNFRIFLTMDPVNGELSRAMRNRCVELYFTHSLSFETGDLTLRKEAHIDYLGVLHLQGMRSVDLASKIINSHLGEHKASYSSSEEICCPRRMVLSTGMASSLLIRGISGRKALLYFLQVGYELEEHQALQRSLDYGYEGVCQQARDVAVSGGAVRRLWGQKSSWAHVSWEARVIQLFGEQSLAAWELQKKLLNCDKSDAPLPARLNMLSSQIDQRVDNSLSVSRSLIKLYLAKMALSDLEPRVHYFSGYQGDFIDCLHWMAKYLHENILFCRGNMATVQSSGQSSIAESSEVSFFQQYPCYKTLAISRQRLDKLYSQEKWLKQISGKNACRDLCMGMTVLEASYLASESFLDPTTISCPVTLTIYAFFAEIDKLVIQLFRESTKLDTVEDENLSRVVIVLLRERDRLWELLKRTRVMVQSSSFLGFEESEFLVQWRWLKRALEKIDHHAVDNSPGTVTKTRTLNVLISQIDNVIFGKAGDSWSSWAVSKKLMRPRVPRQSVHWKTYFDMTRLARECSLVEDEMFSPFGTPSSSIELTSLVEQSHPLLFIDQSFRGNLLGVISTMHSYWTDEVVTDEHVLVGVDLNKNLRELIEERRTAFTLLVSRARVDTNISTVENQFTAENLDELRDSSLSSLESSQAYNMLTNGLLSSYAQIQLSSFEEFRCVLEERSIIGEICRAITFLSNDEEVISRLKPLLPKMRMFISTCLSCVVWPVSEIRPYQTLIWVLENWGNTSQQLTALLRSLVPHFLKSLSSHLWSNSFNRVGIVTTRLQVPNLWVDDESLNTKPRAQDEVEGSFGSNRLQQQVRTELLFLFVGEQLVLQKQSRNTRFFTVENCEHRVRQYRVITKAISSRPKNDPMDALWIMHSLAKDIFIAIRDGLPCIEFDQLVQLIDHPHLLVKASLGTFEEFVTSTHQLLLDTLVPLILPLLGCFQNALTTDPSTAHYRKTLAIASVYLGLLRLRISTPQSPLDPGQAPLAKVSLIDRRLSDLRTEVDAQRLYSGLTTGDFMPGTPELEEMIAEGEHLLTKRASQARKVVERPPDANPFHELFRFCRDFAERVSPISGILELVSLMMEGKDKNLARRRLENWMRTSSAFCQRIESDFPGFDDVTMTLLHSIRMIQDGLETLSHQLLTPTTDGVTETSLFQHFVRFPISNYDDTVRLTRSFLPAIEEAKGKLVDRNNLNFAISSASLSRLLLKKLVCGLNHVELQWCLMICDTLSNARGVTFETEDAGKSLEDELERKFREQFPDHRSEFNELFEEKDDDDVSYNETTPADVDDHDDLDQSNLSDSQIEMICLSLRQLFDPTSATISDSTRMMVFHHGYNAAFLLDRHFACTKHHAMEPMAGHAFAMMLSMPPKGPSPKVFAHLHGESSIIDFQNEPNPSEVMRAKGPLERLMARATQLLTAFPGHSILLGIGRVCDKVCKFDIMTTSIGKVMTGMEVILRQAQEWEQHASDRVRLGAPLQEIGKLVAAWRKLELESWPQLILARRRRYERRARKHLIRVLGVLRSSAIKPELNVGDQAPELHSSVANGCVAPKWVWPGDHSVGQWFCRLMDNSHAVELTELTKILDTFMLTSPLGQYHERLAVLKIAAREQDMEYRLSSDTWTLQKSRALWSIHAYYSQFESILTNKIDSMIAPIQTKLKDEVKLAKWDDQTYYSLAESTEKNHRKLMKLLAELDESLDFNVGHLIQEEKIKGIRKNVDSSGDVSSSVPSDSAMFPHLERDTGEALSADNGSTLTENRTWTNISTIDIEDSQSKTILQIQRYARKMDAFRKANQAGSEWAIIGTAESSYLCGAIFERISALRNKAARPMKERALTDLFRELKRNGFTTTKWGVPQQVRMMEQLFQIPKPEFDSNIMDQAIMKQCERGEMYFQRCLSELNEYRSECILLGSKHLTKRQTDMMLTFGESGMFLLAQQRCLLSSMARQVARLGTSISLLAFTDQRLPLDQEWKFAKLEAFEASYLVALESVRQLSLVVKSSHPLFVSTSEAEWVRDTAAKLQGCVEILESCGTFNLDKDRILTKAHLQQHDEKIKGVHRVQTVVESCRVSCEANECLPLDCFDTALERLHDATVKECVETTDALQDTGIDRQPFLDCLSTAIERCLIGFQAFVKCVPDKTKEQEFSVWRCHKELLDLWVSTNIVKLNESMSETIFGLKAIHNSEGDLTTVERETLVGVASDVAAIASHIQSHVKSLLEQTVTFHAHSAKLVYVLLRIFRVLLSQGFCSDEICEDDDNKSGGDVEGMTFEDDQEGTGMGEGDGKRDVTDQLESEEQLSGLKNEQQDGDKDEKKESRQLNEEEANQGMEMEADFDGEMCDVPDKPQDENDDNSEGEELDREMSQDASPDEQVVDERMWNDSDDEDDIKNEEEKFEKDSGVEGEAIEGATRTKDDDEGKQSEKGDQPEEKQDTRPEEDNGMESGADGDSEINDDNEDRYEDQHGIDVKGEENGQDENANDDNEPMQLDEDMNLDGDDNADPSMEEDSPKDGEESDHDEGEADQAVQESNPEPEDDAEEDGVDAAAAPVGTADRMDGDDDIDKEEDPENDETNINAEQHKPANEQVHGVRASNGTEGILDDAMDENQEEGKVDEAEEGGDPSGSQGAAQSQSNSSGGSGVGERDGAVEETSNVSQDENRAEIPNPFKNPGDASKFWHKRLNIVETNETKEENNQQEQNDLMDKDDPKGDFQYTSQEDDNAAQVLGEATEEEAIKLQPPEEEKPENEENDVSRTDEIEKKPASDQEQHTKRQQKRQSAAHQRQLKEQDEESMSENNLSTEEKAEEEDDEGQSQGSTELDEGDNDVAQNRVVSDLSRLQMEGKDDSMEIDGRMIEDEPVSGISSSEAAEARTHWLRIQGETYSLSRRLCEKLRLVMEPLVASKLRGDYRTGKRINMKRVIGYIASGYRKDKIWLRRTKPAKRDYRVLLAVDDSESMKKSGAGEMALRALATLAIGMNQLEIGELGIASFGEDMKLLHPFHLPFSADSGTDMMRHFKFDQARTRTSLCVESAIAALDSMGSHSSMQLVFLVSDGRIERDSRDKLKRLIREMMERNILLAMIIVEGEHKKKDSIVNMKEVTFEKGKPVVKRFIEEYPFPYYIILDNMTALPEVLGDALRQWFEMLAQVQSPR